MASKCGHGYKTLILRGTIQTVYQHALVFKRLIRIKSTNFIDCLLRAINKVENRSFPLITAGKALLECGHGKAPAPPKSEWATNIQILLHQPFLVIHSAIVAFHPISGA